MRRPVSDALNGSSSLTAGVNQRNAQPFRVDVHDFPVAVHQHEAFGDGVKDIAAAVAFGTLGLSSRGFDGRPCTLGHVTRKADIELAPVVTVGTV
ncbi:hypothetical protein [Caballeronia zhejiangensis]|uniref:hypothetical protein n=1 Tax=Caballeronia zhejiangensis TaxID=871203 RepID=UPI001FD5F85E|nr:hypothetical protein [Caballeronia zhejiangensis]